MTRIIAGFVVAGSLVGAPAWSQETPAPGDTIRLVPIEANVSRILDRNQARATEHLRVGDASVPYVDLADWLASRTAIQVRSYGGGGRQVLTIRGSRPEGVLVLLDGLPLNDPVSGIADLSTVSLPTLSTATLVRGAGSARYGSGALGGALILTTRTGGVGSAGRLAIGSEGRFDTQVSSGVEGRAGRLLLSAGRRYSRNDFAFRNRLMPGAPEERRRNADTETNSVALSASSGGARATVRYDRLERGVPGRMGTSLFDGDRWSEDRWSASGAVARPDATLSAGLRELRLRFAPGTTAAGTGQRAFDARLGGETLIGGSTALAVRLSFERISGDGIAGTPDRAGAGGTVRRAFETRLPAVGTAWIEPVLGIDHADGETSWSPELGAWLRPTRATRVYGRLGRGFRLPTFGDLYFGAAPGVRANPDLRSERITLDAEVGVEAGLPIGPALGTVRVAGYARHTDRPIVWLASSVALWSPQNLDRLSSRGMEIEIGFETDAEARHGLRLDAGFTLQRSRVGFAANRNPLPYQPDRAGRVGLEGRRGPLALRLAARFTGSRTTSIAGTRRLPAFTVIDAAVRRGIDVGSLALGLSARLDNLFDHRYELIELFPEPGRQLTISLHIR